MATMSADLALTRADLEAMPEDGRRHELLEGAIVVTPSPGFAHQKAVMTLLDLLRPGLPDGLVLFTGPFDVVLSERSVVVPDLLVAARTQFTDRDLPGAPLLIVEVASPSTRLIDRTTKRDLYERAGVPSYWLVDPAGPTITVLQLQHGRYREAAVVHGGATVQVDQPYAVLLGATALGE
jgi:Uma2 family endonuclease